MTEWLLKLPDHLRERLAGALETGALAPPYSALRIKSVLGRGNTQNILRALAELEELGISGAPAAAWLRSVNRTFSGMTRPDFVWSGPEVPGLHARDTRRVFEALLGTAERSLWICSFAYFDGPSVFEVLARRMEQKSDLQVTLLLNIQRKPGDTTAAEQRILKFAERFWKSDWPGKRRPAVFFDPRSLELDRPGGMLHAKAVVADHEAVFITSANLTAAAIERNIEMGLLVRDRALATCVENHFCGLIDRKLLHPLPII